MATAKIRAANNASMSTLAPHLPRIESRSSNYSISLISATALTPEVKDRIYTLFHSNMSAMASSSSLSYTESSKREELFDHTGRFILLSKTEAASASDLDVEGGGVDMPGGMPRVRTDPIDPKSAEGSGLRGKGKGKSKETGTGVGTQEGAQSKAQDLLGYVSFRFDTEETLSSKDAEVIYCYELQLDQTVRKLGLANVLMDEMERIGRTRKMDKAMLTCYKNNSPALSFYRKQGYEADEIDPTRMEEEDSDRGSGDEGWEQVQVEGEDGEAEENAVDYVILSKTLR